MEDFCKIVTSEKYGKILVIKDSDEKCNPAVFVKFHPEGLGVCGPTFSYSDEDEMAAWGKVDRMYESMDLNMLDGICDEVMSMLTGLT